MQMDTRDPLEDGKVLKLVAMTVQHYNLLKLIIAHLKHADCIASKSYLSKAVSKMNLAQEREYKNVHCNFPCINNNKKIGNNLNAHHRSIAK